MTGRGIDQILPSPSSPRLYERYVDDARVYVELAERRSGRVPTPAPPEYVWGAARATLSRRAPDAFVMNLETTITLSEQPWPAKGIHYRMHPRNAPVLTQAGTEPDKSCCILANNHILDWGYQGLADTLMILRERGIAFSGAGGHAAQAEAAGILPLSEGVRAVIVAAATPDSGVPEDWKAQIDSPGVNLVSRFSDAELHRLQEAKNRACRQGDLAIASLHWGGNWGYRVPPNHRGFAHRLIDEAGFDVVFGHSSHHPKGFEIHNDKLILYGAGDLINDYEGIGGHSEYAPELGLLYFAGLEPTSGQLNRLEMVPFVRRRLRLEYADEPETSRIAGVLAREARRLGTELELRIAYDRGTPVLQSVR